MCDPLDKTCHIYVEDNTKPPSVGVELFWLQMTDTFQTLRFEGEIISIYYSSVKAMWGQARSHCSQMGGYMIDLDCMEDYDAVRFVTREHLTERAYVGGTDELEEGNWVTVKDGAPINNAVWRWASGEPKNYKGIEHFALLNLKKMDINDVAAANSKAYICEKDVE